MWGVRWPPSSWRDSGPRCVPRGKNTEAHLAHVVSLGRRGFCEALWSGDVPNQDVDGGLVDLTREEIQPEWRDGGEEGATCRRGAWLCL